MPNKIADFKGKFSAINRKFEISNWNATFGNRFKGAISYGWDADFSLHFRMMRIAEIYVGIKVWRGWRRNFDITPELGRNRKEELLPNQKMGYQQPQIKKKVYTKFQLQENSWTKTNFS